jgi:LPPG:FO 2-phospho-L-lactate transferase
VTAQLAERLGVSARLLPATDDPLRTWLETPAGTFPFQEWFVARRHQDEVDAVHFEGGNVAWPAPGVLEALESAELILFAPSNPYVSIGPILAVHQLRAALRRRRVHCVAVSPLIGGGAVKGPADRMLQRLAGGTSPRHVASCYPGLIDALVVDEADADDLGGLGDVRPIVTRTLMSDDEARRRLAEVALKAGGAVGRAAGAWPEDQGAVPA